LLPAVAFLILAAVFLYRLARIDAGDTPDLIPSVMINRPVPTFSLPALKADKPGLSNEDFRGRVTLVNFFSSWCVPCRAEHPLLVALAKQGKVALVGVDYKDKPADGLDWLDRLGDPFERIAADRDGRVAIDWGVYGVPESYLVDREGRIRFKQVGPFSEQDIQTKLLPLVAELSK